MIKMSFHGLGGVVSMIWVSVARFPPINGEGSDVAEISECDRIDKDYREETRNG